MGEEGGWMSMWGSWRAPAHRGYGSAVIQHLSISAFIPFYRTFSSETIAKQKEELRHKQHAHQNKLH